MQHYGIIVLGGLGRLDVICGLWNLVVSVISARCMKP